MSEWIAAYVGIAMLTIGITGYHLERLPAEEWGENPEFRMLLMGAAWPLFLPWILGAAASGMETRQGQDRGTGLGAKHDSPARDSGDAQKEAP